MPIISSIIGSSVSKWLSEKQKYILVDPPTIYNNYKA